jgi:hypothetical protein
MCLFTCYCEFANGLCSDAIRASGCKPVHMVRLITNWKGSEQKRLWRILAIILEFFLEVTWPIFEPDTSLVKNSATQAKVTFDTYVENF